MERWALFIATFLLILGTASAEVIFGGGKSIVDDYDDLVLIGGGFSYSGTVSRDLVLIGGGNRINSEVGGNLVLIGGGHNFTGTAGGDAVVVGGGNQLGGTVEKDAVFVGGGNVLKQTSLIKGDVTQIGAGNQFLGTVYGKVSGGEVEDVSENRIVGLTGIPSFVGSGQIALFFGIMGFFGQLLTGSIVVFLLLWLLNKKTLELAKFSRENPERKAWDGFAASLVLALVLVLATITVILAPFSIPGIILLSVVFSVSKYFAYPWMVDHAFRLAGKKPMRRDVPAKFLLGVLIYVMIGWIPLVGWVLRLYINFLGFGALVQSLRNKKPKKRTKSP